MTNIFKHIFTISFTVAFIQLSTMVEVLAQSECRKGNICYVLQTATERVGSQFASFSAPKNSKGNENAPCVGFDGRLSRDENKNCMIGNIACPEGVQPSEVTGYLACKAGNDNIRLFDAAGNEYKNFGDLNYYSEIKRVKSEDNTNSNEPDSVVKVAGLNNAYSKNESEYYAVKSHSRVPSLVEKDSAGETHAIMDGEAAGCNSYKMQGRGKISCYADVYKSDPKKVDELEIAKLKDNQISIETLAENSAVDICHLATSQKEAATHSKNYVKPTSQATNISFLQKSASSMLRGDSHFDFGNGVISLKLLKSRELSSYSGCKVQGKICKKVLVFKDKTSCVDYDNKESVLFDKPNSLQRRKDLIQKEILGLPNESEFVDVKKMLSNVQTKTTSATIRSIILEGKLSELLSKASVQGNAGSGQRSSSSNGHK